MIGDPERGPNVFTPEEEDEYLRTQKKSDGVEEDIATGERDVDGEIAPGDVGDNDTESEAAA